MCRIGNVGWYAALDGRRGGCRYVQSILHSFSKYTDYLSLLFQLYQSKLPPPVPEDVVLSELADDFRRKCFAM